MREKERGEKQSKPLESVTRDQASWFYLSCCVVMCLGDVEPGCSQCVTALAARETEVEGSPGGSLPCCTLNGMQHYFLAQVL